MNKNKKILIWLLVALVVMFIPICYLFVDSFHDNIRKQPVRYCYQEYYGPPNEVLIVLDKDNVDDLITYYREIEKGNDATFDFNLKTLPMTEPVYVMSYIKNDTVAEVVSYHDYGLKRGGSYTRGYVYSKTLHITPPNLVENE